MLPKELQFTYSDYKEFPEDGKRYEILEGRLLMVPSPFINHQRVSGRLFWHINKYVKENGLGEIFHPPCDVILSEINVVQPDIIFISKENAQIITEENIKGTPDLLIEILSKTSKKNDEIIKKKIYANNQVNEYWIVDPVGSSVKVYVEPKKGYKLLKEFFEVDTISTPTFPELNLSLQFIFS